jgi:hypothetical protein
MTLRSLLIIPIAATAALAFALPATAAPDNKNTGTFEVDCEGIGNMTIVEVQRGQGDGAVFTVDGEVVVARSITGSGETVFSFEGGPTIVFPEEFEEINPGAGAQDRLVSCDFTITFEDEFVANRNFLRRLGLDNSLLGVTVTVEGEITGTAEVIFPGN